MIDPENEQLRARIKELEAALESSLEMTVALVNDDAETYRRYRLIGADRVQAVASCVEDYRRRLGVRQGEGMEGS